MVLQIVNIRPTTHGHENTLYPRRHLYSLNIANSTFVPKTVLWVFLMILVCATLRAVTRQDPGSRWLPCSCPRGTTPAVRVNARKARHLTIKSPRIVMPQITSLLRPNANFKEGYARKANCTKPKGSDKDEVAREHGSGPELSTVINVRPQGKPNPQSLPLSRLSLLLSVRPRRSLVLVV